MINVNKPRYLRVSLLSGCNLNCSYCQPLNQPQTVKVAPVDKVRSAIDFLYHRGIRKIRFTGGEPTLYKEMPALVAYVKAIDKNITLAITSNGLMLRKKASELSIAGLDSVNISLDSINRDLFRALTGRDKLNDVLAGIDYAVQRIKKVKINCVLIRGVNDHEIADMIRFADNRKLDIRFIEFMPNRYSAPGDSRFISSEEIRDSLPWDLKPLSGDSNGAARYFTDSNLKIKVGFISSVSHPFCSGCDRIRLTADGLLYNCLYDSNNINLFDLLESKSEKAINEFNQLITAKRFAGCSPSGVDSDLPSFSAIGG